jgi:Di-sulfide bridge nucleocytoplasmic transport domain
MCAERFRLNRCGTDMAVPALDGACAQWARCMARDPAIVGKARVAAETFAEIVNGFVDVISWKSMIFCLAVLVVIVRAANSTFNFFRSQSKERRKRREHTEEQHHHPSSTASHPPPFAFPQAAYTQSMRWHEQASPPATPARKRVYTGKSRPELDPPETSSFALQ